MPYPDGIFEPSYQVPNMWSHSGQLLKLQSRCSSSIEWCSWWTSGLPNIQRPTQPQFQGSSECWQKLTKLPATSATSSTLSGTFRMIIGDRNSNARRNDSRGG